MLLPKKPRYSCISSMTRNRRFRKNAAPISCLFQDSRLPRKDMFRYSGLVSSICGGCCRSCAFYAPLLGIKPGSIAVV